MRGEHNRQAGRQAGPQLYADVTARIIAELEEGRLPWVQPWDAVACGCTMPQNAGTARRYTGINVLILWAEVVAKGYASQRWLTYRQAEAAGGNVRRGEKGTVICYADRFTPKAERERAAAEGEEARSVPFLKRFTVFNVAQCDGLPGELLAPPAILPESETVPAAEALITATGAAFHVGGAMAFYMPSLDCIEVPPQAAFHEPVNYYRTCLHELGHWTGHPSRLVRDLSGRFGSRAYAAEELVAEMASAFVCAALGIVPTVRHADYIASWLDLLRDDDRAIFRAASLASKAADFLLAFRAEGIEPGEGRAA